MRLKIVKEHLVCDEINLKLTRGQTEINLKREIVFSNEGNLTVVEISTVTAGGVTTC